MDLFADSSLLSAVDLSCELRSLPFNRVLTADYGKMLRFRLSKTVFIF